MRWATDGLVKLVCGAEEIWLGLHVMAMMASPDGWLRMGLVLMVSMACVQ